MRPLILSLCDYTGEMVKPWLESGWDAAIVDPQHAASSLIITDSGTRLYRIANVIDSDEVSAFVRENFNRVKFVAGFPPCTDLAVSGARWFTTKAEKDTSFQFKAMQVVWQCYDIARFIGCPYMIENPVSQISTYWRKADYTFHPYQFTGLVLEDNYTKRTCLWTGQGFVMPRPNLDSNVEQAITAVIAEFGCMLPKNKLPKNHPEYVFYPDNRIHTAPPGDERANFRSATPAGFAMAVCSSNRTISNV